MKLMTMGERLSALRVACRDVDYALSTEQREDLEADFAHHIEAVLTQTAGFPTKDIAKSLSEWMVKHVEAARERAGLYRVVDPGVGA